MKTGPVLLAALLCQVVIARTLAAAQCDSVKLVPGDPADAQEFSWAVAADGETLLIGAFGRSADGTLGAAYVFERLAGVWTERAKLVSPETWNGFGQAVSLRDGRALVGARYDNERGTEAGAAYVFAGAGDTWTLEAKLLAADGAADDELGQCVAISGETAIVGAPYDDDDGSFSGSAYLFERVLSTWTQAAKLTAEDAVEGQVFGSAVALDGDRAAVGATGDDTFDTNSGAVYLFRRENGAWVQEAKVTCSTPSAHHGFGSSVALSGDVLLVGTFGDDEQGTDAGAAYVYRRSNGVWSEEARLLGRSRRRSGRGRRLRRPGERRPVGHGARVPPPQWAVGGGGLPDGPDAAGQRVLRVLGGGERRARGRWQPR